MLREIFDAANVWAAVPLAAAGFVWTIILAWKAKSAAQSARDAAKNAEALLSKNQLVLLIPILYRVEADLESALGSGEKLLVMYHLNSWRWHASQLRSYIGTLKQPEPTLGTAIQKSIALAAEAKIGSQKPGVDLPKTCKPALKSIADVTGELGRLAAVETASAGR